MNDEAPRPSGPSLGALIPLGFAATLLILVWIAVPDEDPPPPPTTLRTLGETDPNTEASLPPPTQPPASTHAPTSTPTIGYDPESDRIVFESDVFSVRYPADWTLAEGEQGLVTGIGWYPISLGTFPLRPGAEDCPAIPENALEDMGADDALLTLFVGGGRGDPPGTIFGSGFPPTGDFGFAACIDRGDTLDLRWGESWDHGRPFYVQVAFGPDVSEETRREAYAILNGLALEWPLEAMTIAPRANARCEPAAPFDYRADGVGVEGLLSPVPFEAWALVDRLPPFLAGTPVPFILSLDAAAPILVTLSRPGVDAIEVEAEAVGGIWNPAGGSTWRVTLMFPAPGCWTIEIVTEKGTLTSWVEAR